MGAKFELARVDYLGVARKKGCSITHSCFSSSLRIRCIGSVLQEVGQDGVRYARDLLGKMLGREHREGARGGWENCQTEIDPIFGKGKERKEGGIGRVLDCSAMLRKFRQIQWRVLDLKLPVREALYLPGTGRFRVSAALSLWLGWAGGKHRAFSVNPAALRVTIPAVRDLGGAFSGLPHPTPCATWLFCGCHEPLFLRGNFEEGDQWNQLQLPSLLLHLISGT